MSAIDQIKERLDAVALISEYVQLTKSGRNFKARCPFHNERTASFYVFPQTGTWRCFGACATGGDIFGFVMKQQGLDFSGALHQLADKAGVQLVEFTRDPAVEQHESRLQEATQLAALFYHQLLLNSKDAASVRAYVQKRGINQEMTDAFMLGYSPQKRDALKSHLTERGFTTDELQEAGLIVEGQNGLVDRFWHRLMFPIWTASGSLAGFGARTLGDAQPKYLNSPQTPLFDKGGILYGLNRAQEGIRREKKVVIVEGYMDALMAHQYGFTNVVASMGTSLTETQVQLLSRYTSTLVLALDPDTAGQTAMLRSLETAPAAMGQETVAVPDWKGKVRVQQKGGRVSIGNLPQGTMTIVSRHKGEIRVLELPGDKDPDELIQTSPEQWPELVNKSVPMMDFLIKAVTQRVDLTSPRGKAQAVEDALPYIAELPSVVEQGHYLQQLSGIVGVDERTLRTALPAPKRRQSTATVQEQQLRQHFDRTQALEDYCLALLTHNAFLRDDASALLPEHFLSTEGRALFLAWRDNPGAGLSEVIDSSLRDRLDIIDATALPPMGEQQARAALGQCMRRLEERRLRELKMLHQMRTATAYEGEVVELPVVEAATDEEAEPTDTEDLALNRDLQQLMVEQTLKHKKL